MEQTTTAKIYEFDGVQYRMERLSFQQAQWMGEHVLFDVDLGEIDELRLHELLRQRGHLLLAIALIEVGQTRRDKSAQDWAAIATLARALAGNPVDDILAAGRDFFFIHPYESLVGMLSGEQIRALRRKALALAIANGSRNVSSSSAMETSPSSAPSSPSGDRTIVSDICSDGSSTAPPSGPSLDSVGSSCPG